MGDRDKGYNRRARKQKRKQDWMAIWKGDFGDLVRKYLIGNILIGFFKNGKVPIGLKWSKLKQIWLDHIKKKK